MANQAELQFIVKMRDETSAVVQQVKSSIGSASAAIVQWNNATKAAGQSVVEHVAALKQHARAMADSMDAQTKAAAATKEGTKSAKEHGEAHAKASEGVKKHGEAHVGLVGKMGEMKKAAMETGEALVAMWASNEIIKGAVEAFERSELALQKIAYAADMGKEHLEEFNKAAKELDMQDNMGPVGAMRKLEEQAAKLGARSTEDILAFTKSVALLSKGGGMGPEEMGKAMERLIITTHSSIAETQKFADVAATLGKHSIMNAGQIIEETASLERLTSELGISTTEMMVWAEQAKASGQMPRMFAMEMATVMRNFRKEATDGGKGIEEFADRLHISTEKAAGYLKTPNTAMIKLLEVTRAIMKAGNDPTSFLEKFKIDGRQAETFKVMAAGLDNYKRKLAEVNAADAGSGKATNAQAEANSTPLERAMQRAENAWEHLKASFGKGMSPVIGTVFEVLASAMEHFSKAVDAIPVPLQVVLGTIADVVMVVGSAALAFGWLNALLGLVGTSIGGILMGALTMLTSGFGLVIKVGLAVISMLGSIVGTIGLVPILIGIAVAGVIAFVTALYTGVSRNWEQIKGLFKAGELKKAWDVAWQGAKDAVKEFFDWAWSYATWGWDKLKGIFSNQVAGAFKDPNEKPHPTEGDAHGNPGGEAGAPPAAANDNAPATGGQSGIMAEMGKKVSSLEKIRQGQIKINELTRDYDTLVKQNANATATDKRTAEQMQSAKQLLEIEQRRADPMREFIYQTQKAGLAMGDITQAEKDERAIQNELIKLYEQGVVITEKRAAAVRQVLEAQQAVQKATTQVKDVQGLKDQIDTALALTRTEKDRVAIAQQRRALEEDKGLTTAQVSQQLKLLQTHKDIVRALEQEDKLGGTGKAKRDYDDELKFLNARKDITEAQKAREREALNQQTLGSRDPMAKEMQTLQDQLRTLKIGGEYRESDVKTTEKLIELERQGVRITQEQAQALAEANRNLQDAQKAQSSGIAGFVNATGSLRDNLNDMTKNFADGLSSAIGNALDRKKDAFRSFLADFGKQLRQMAIKQIMAQIFTEGTGDSTKGISGLFSKLFMDSGAQGRKNGVDALTKKFVNGKEGDDKGAGIGGDAAKQAADALKNAKTAVMQVKADLVQIQNNNAGTNVIDPGAGANPFISKDQIKNLPAAPGNYGAQYNLPSSVFGLDGFKPVTGGQFGMGGGIGSSLKTFGAGLQPTGSSDLKAEIDRVSAERNLNPRDLAAAMSYETGGTMNTNKWGGKGGNYLGGIQFGPDEQKKYGVYEGMPVHDHMTAVSSFIKDRGASGQDLAGLYKTINGGNPNAPGWRSDGNGTIDEHIANIRNSKHMSAYDRLGGGKADNDNTGSIDDAAQKMKDAAKIMETPKALKDPNLTDEEASKKYSEMLANISPASQARVQGAMSAVPAGAQAMQQVSSMTVNAGSVSVNGGAGTSAGTGTGVDNTPTGSIANSGVPNGSVGFNGTGSSGANDNSFMGMSGGDALGFLGAAGAGAAIQRGHKKFQAASAVPMGMMILKKLLMGGGLQSLTKGLGSMGSSMSSGLGSLFGGGADAAAGAGADAAGAVAGDAASGAGELASLLPDLAMIFHGGGKIGSDTPPGGYRSLPVSTWTSAIRLHTGTPAAIKANEYPAVLERGERVLTEAQDARTSATMAGLADAAANANGPNVTQNNQRSHTFNFNASFKSGDGFRRSQGQIASEMQKQSARMYARNA